MQRLTLLEGLESLKLYDIVFKSKGLRQAANAYIRLWKVEDLQNVRHQGQVSIPQAMKDTSTGSGDLPGSHVLTTVNDNI